MKRWLAVLAIAIGVALGTFTAAPVDARERIDICDYFRNTLICGDLP